MLDSRASVFIAMKDPQNAIEDAEAALADRETPVRLFHQAQAYALAGQQSKARGILEKAIKSGLVKKMLQPLEWPDFDKLQNFPK
jgi:hypothetical protein